MNHVYLTNFTIDLAALGIIDESPLRRIEILNPAASDVDLAILRIADAGNAGAVEFTLNRYTELATHGTGGNVPTQATMYKLNPADPAPAFEVWFATAVDPSAQLIWPADNAIDFERTYNLVPSDTGDDGEFDEQKYRQADEVIRIPPGCSASIRMPIGQATYKPILLIKEITKGSENSQLVAPDAVHGTLFGEYRTAFQKTLSYAIHSPPSMISLGGTAARHHTFVFNSAGDGAIEYLPNTRAVKLTIGAADGARASYRQNLYNPYNPACQQRITSTSKFGTPHTNQEIRVGYFDDEDGVGTLQTDAGAFLFVRSSTTGSVVETLTALPSTVNLAKDNISVKVFEWLGAGDVQLFANNALAVHKHQAGNLDEPFMKRANLPFSVEIKNVGASSAGDVTFYCMKVGSEGADVLDVATNSKSVATGAIPQAGLMLLQIRPKLTITLGSIAAQDNRAIYLPKRITVSTSIAAMTVRAYLNGTVGGSPDWNDTDDVGVEFDVAGTFTGGSGTPIGFGSIDAAIGTTVIDLSGRFRIPGDALTIGAFSGQAALQIVGFARTAPVTTADVIIEWERVG